MMIKNNTPPQLAYRGGYTSSRGSAPGRGSPSSRCPGRAGFRRVPIPTPVGGSHGSTHFMENIQAMIGIERWGDPIPDDDEIIGGTDDEPMSLRLVIDAIDSRVERKELFAEIFKPLVQLIIRNRQANPDYDYAKKIVDMMIMDLPARRLLELHSDLPVLEHYVNETFERVERMRLVPGLRRGVARPTAPAEEDDGAEFSLE